MRANISIDDFSGQDLLEQWTWLLGEPYAVIAMNNFGDMFVRANDGRILMVNVTWGTMETLAPSTEEFERLTRERENQRKWFLTDFLTELEHTGLTLAKGECFGFTLPLRLGGKMELLNVEVAPVRMHISMMGQIHRQLKDVPPGTKIKGVQIE